MMEMLSEPDDAQSLEETRRLVDLMAHVTERSDSIGPEHGLDQAAECVRRWRRWWMVYQADYVRLSGAERVAAFALETRYGKWILETWVLRVSTDSQGRPLLDELVRRARVTFGVLLLGMALAYLLAIPLGALSAHHRGRAVDRFISLLVLAPYALWPTVVALLAFGLGAEVGAATLGAALVLAGVLLADPTRHQRAELLPVLASDYVRAAIARGAGPVRVLLVHALRNAAVPVVTRVALELPMAMSACFVLEHVFGLDGLGVATVEAVQQGDAGWLMSVAVLGAAWAVIALVLNDVLYGLLDPRMRVRLLRLQGRRR
jgi:ABC-type dipeptide/oligopeptide/nickel transport system permease component